MTTSHNKNTQTHQPLPVVWKCNGQWQQYQASFHAPWYLLHSKPLPGITWGGCHIGWSSTIAGQHKHSSSWAASFLWCNVECAHREQSVIGHYYLCCSFLVWPSSPIQCSFGWSIWQGFPSRGTDQGSQKYDGPGWSAARLDTSYTFWWQVGPINNGKQSYQQWQTIRNNLVSM